MTSTQALNIDLSMSFGTAAVYLYDSANNRIDSDSGDTGHDGWINRTLTAGTYYIDVSNTTDSQFTLTTSTGLPTVGGIATDTAGATLAAARALGTLGSTPTEIADAIGGSDQLDFYAFNVASTSQINVLLSGLSGYSYLYVLNASGQTIFSTSGDATSNASIKGVLPFLTPGSYYVEVQGTSSQLAGYNLSVAATPTPTLAGGTMLTARPMGTLGTATATFKDSLNSVANAQYYSFSLSAPSSVYLALSGLTDATTLYLLDATGHILRSQVGSYANGTADLTGYFPTLSLGTYFVEVVSSLYNTIIEPYTLTAQASAVVDSGGNTIATATALGTIGTTPTVRAGYLGTVNPNDYYQFNLAAAATVNVHFTATYDEYLSLYAANGSTLVGAVHARNGALDMSYTLAAGSYYLDAQPASGEDEAYAITLSTAPIAVGSSASNVAGSSLAAAKSLGTLSATPVETAEWVGTGNLDDWYTVTLASAGRLQVDLSGNTSGVYLYFLNASGGSIDSSNTSSSTFTGGTAVGGTSMWDVLAAGTYYVHVQDANSSLNTGYHLSSSVTASGGGALPDVAGNTTALGLNIGTLGTTVQTFSDYVGATDPDDYYQFTLTSNATVNAKLSNISFGDSSSTLYLRDISGNEIFSDTMNQYYSANIQRVLSPGIYFFDVRNFSANTYNLTMSATPLASTSSSALSTAASFLPTAAGIAAQIDVLEQQVKAGALGSITLSDPGTPILRITYAQAVADIDVLKAIVTPYVLNLSGTPVKYAGATLASLGLASTAVQSVQFADGRLVLNTADAVAQVYRMYLSAFGRDPDPSGQHSWNQQVEGGTSLVTMAQGFIGSAEFTARYGTNVSDTSFVTLLYKNVLNRTPDSGGLTSWLAALSGGQSRAQVLVSFSESPEHIAATASGVKAGLWDLDEVSAQVARMYDTVLGRIPDAGGLASWSNAMRAGQSLSSVAAAFVASPEFQAAYGLLGNYEFVSKLYVNALHRTADPAGLAGWVAQLNAGASRASVVIGFSESAEHQANTVGNVNNASPSLAGILASGPVIATGSVIASTIDTLQSQVASHVITGLTVGGSGTTAVPISLPQLVGDKDAIRFLTGNYYLDMRSVPVGTSSTVQALNLGATSSAKYVQFADGRLVFDSTDRAAQVFRMYDAAFGRAPDSAGEHSWSQVLASGTSLATVADSFINSAESIARYGAGLSDSVFVTQLYANVLHRSPDAPGLNGWLLTLGGGTSRAQVLTSFSESAEHISNTAAAIRVGIYDIG